jgi:hypothetical protein
MHLRRTPRGPQAVRMVATGALDYARSVEAIPLGRLGRPDEIASTVLWLCSPGASFITGVALRGDHGGFDGAGQDGVDADALASVLLGGALGEADDGVLGAVIGRHDRGRRRHRRWRSS